MELKNFDVENLYDTLNKKHFEGLLGKIPVRICDDLGNSLGVIMIAYRQKLVNKNYARVFDHAIEIKLSSKLSVKNVERILVHEMCHYWTGLMFEHTRHNGQFWEKMKQCGYPKNYVSPDALLHEVNDHNAGFYDRYSARAIRKRGYESLSGAKFKKDDKVTSQTWGKCWVLGVIPNVSSTGEIKSYTYKIRSMDFRESKSRYLVIDILEKFLTPGW